MQTATDELIEVARHSLDPPRLWLDKTSSCPIADAVLYVMLVLRSLTIHMDVVALLALSMLTAVRIIDVHVL